MVAGFFADNSGYAREQFICGVASQLERAQPWIDRRPPVRA
ncbi:MAG TPA: hypothetical protein VIX59_02120 [Candidatus Binataceae bacterium]